MPGASQYARRVKVLNANWVAGADGEDGQFEIMVITDDGERHVMAPSPASAAALAALVRDSTVLVWSAKCPGPNAIRKGAATAGRSCSVELTRFRRHPGGFDGDAIGHHLLGGRLRAASRIVATSMR